MVLLLPRGWGLKVVRAVVTLYSLLHDDRRILERMEFHRGFAEADAPLRRFADLVDGMERV